MGAVATLTSSTVGKKVVMAVTGLIMVGFVFVHMTGNLLVFLGAEEFDHYAHWIQSGFGASPEFLWAFRLLMIAAIVAHIWAAKSLTKLNVGARPNRYAGGLQSQASGYTARFMAIGGVVILLFLLFHLAHFTTGWVHPDGANFNQSNAFHNLVVGFKGNYLVGGLYILANIALGMHLFHGIFSGAKTLGADPAQWNAWRNAGIGLAVVTAGGNIIIALAGLLGLLG